MGEVQIRPYHEGERRAWDCFVERAKNGHFFFKRDFLSYHGSRFEEASLMIYDHKERLIALLPAARYEKTLHSHPGLTFGGFLVDDTMKTERMLELFSLLRHPLKEEGYERILYSPVPHIHHLKPAEEDLYALWRVGATLHRRLVSAAIPLYMPLRYSNGRKWSVKRAKTAGIEIVPQSDPDAFWEILEELLRERHGARPVHTLEEMRYLKSLFPDAIRIYMAYRDGEPLCGALTFENPTVTHLQYVATTPRGREIGALDLLVDRLIHEAIDAGRRYFDFGTSNEEGGRVLNRGLIDQKERFGARAVVFDRYEWIL